MTKSIRTNSDVENKLDTREGSIVDSEKVNSLQPAFVAEELKEGLQDVLLGLEKMIESSENKSSLIWLVQPIMNFLVRKEAMLDKLSAELMRLKDEGSEYDLNSFINYKLKGVDELKLYSAWTETFGDLWNDLLIQSGLQETHPEYKLESLEEMRNKIRNKSLEEASAKRKQLLETASALLK